MKTVSGDTTVPTLNPAQQIKKINQSLAVLDRQIEDSTSLKKMIALQQQYIKLLDQKTALLERGLQRIDQKLLALGK